MTRLSHNQYYGEQKNVFEMLNIVYRKPSQYHHAGHKEPQRLSHRLKWYYYKFTPEKIAIENENFRTNIQRKK